jgi:hypothetical protein
MFKITPPLRGETPQKSAFVAEKVQGRYSDFNLATFGTNLSHAACSNLISHITLKCYIIECIRPIVPRQLWTALVGETVSLDNASSV